MTKTKKEAVKVTEQADTKSLGVIKLEQVVERLKGFLKDENVTIAPKLTYNERGIFPDIEVRLLPEQVKNIYDETSNSTESA